MTLDQQIAALVTEAPPEPRLRLAIERAVAPVLQATVASQLQHLEYQILQGRDRGDWIVTTLVRRRQAEGQAAEGQKKVIYAFATVEDAHASAITADPQATIAAMPVVQLLFRLLSLPIDSIVFLETPGNCDRGVEIERQVLQAQIQQQLQQLSRSRTELA